MKLRGSQVDALAGATMNGVRKQRLFELRDKGFDVQEDANTGEILVRDKAGGVTRVESLGLRTRVTSAEGATTEFEQYDHGRIKRIVDPAGRGVLFERDRAGLLKAIERGPGGGRFGFELSKDWQPLRIEYPDGTISHAEYTDEGSPSRVTNRDGTEIRYEYTATGRLAAIVDPQGRRTQISYPGPGESRLIEYPDGSRHAYVNDRENGSLRFLVNGELHAEYRSNGKSVEARYQDGSLERFTFDQGRLVEAENQHATVKFTYDPTGRLLTEEVNDEVVQYQRNAVGALVGVVTPQGDSLTYIRDRDQRLTEIVDWKDGRYRISLPASGPATEVSYPNGVRVTATASAMGLPASWTVLAPSSGNIDGANWDYDPCDRLIAAARLGVRREYQYDKASHLTSVRCSGPDLEESFPVDSCGNRTDGSKYDPANRLLRQGGREFTYDALGNLVAELGGPKPLRYRYNGRGQLVGVDLPGGSIEYVYDPLGRRIGKKVDGVTTRFQWAGTQLLSETVDEGKNAIRRDYLFCPEFLTPLAFREGTSVFCIHSGRLQEPLCVTDAAGGIVWQADYLAFGQAHILVDRVRLQMRLPGQYHDEETGLHYSIARYYDSDLGRFLSLDPARSPGATCNYYLYCDGDPLNRIDPTGDISLTLATVLTAVAIGVAVGAAIGAGVELYKQRNQAQIDWGQVGNAALVGGALGGIGAAVGVVAGAALVGTLGVLGAGAAAGGLGNAVTYCVQAAAQGQWNLGDFATSVATGAAIGAVTAGIGGILARRAGRLGAAGEALEGCFVAGTIVAGARGALSIQDVARGDRVFGFDHHQGRWVLADVEQCIKHAIVGKIVHVILGDETIDATDNHPFWVLRGATLEQRQFPRNVPRDEEGIASGRWVEARHLRVGDVLLGRCEERVAVREVLVDDVVAPFVVYNLAVSQLHSYSVGSSGVLVHNKAARATPPRPLQTGGNKIRPSTASELGFENPRDCGRALEALKKDLGLRNDHHGTIMSNGDYVDPQSGEVLGNIHDYAP